VRSAASVVVLLDRSGSMSAGTRDGTLFADARRAVEDVLASLGPDAVLARGYALVRLPDGSLARSAAVARTAPRLSIAFADGELAVRPLDGGAPPETPTSSRPPARAVDQGKLF
jgi:exodeoxyribonuclease VII large subunit